MHTGIHKNQTVSAGIRVRSFKEKSENFALYSSTVLMYAYVLLTKRDVKMAGYCQVLFLRVYGPRRSRGSYTRKKRTRPIYSDLDRTNLVNKGFIIWLSGKFYLRDTAGSPELASILPALVANHIARFGSSCPLAELAI